MNALLNEALINTKHVSHAAIMRRRDGVIKAQSPHFILTPEELEAVDKAFDNPRDARLNNVALKLMSVSYRPIRVDDLALYGKKVIQETSGVIIAKTKNYYIFGTFEPDMIASIAAEAVEKLAEYFRKKDR